MSVTVAMPVGFPGTPRDFERFLEGLGYRLIGRGALRDACGEPKWETLFGHVVFEVDDDRVYCLCCRAHLGRDYVEGAIVLKIPIRENECWYCAPCRANSCRRGEHFFERGHGLIEEWGR